MNTDQPTTTGETTDSTASTAPPEAAASPPAAPPVPQPQAESAATSQAASPWTWGLGRRKTAVARVRLRPGKGEFMINDRSVENYLLTHRDQEAVRAPLKATQTDNALDIYVNVQGGGSSGQAGAVVLGVARALKKTDPGFEAVLREQGFLTRDSRMVERKKYGRRGARRRFQFSKR